MNTELQIVYTDIETGRVARIADYTGLTCPADMEQLSWQTFPKRQFPAGILENMQKWEFKLTREFKLCETDLEPGQIGRINLLSKRADCLEQLSRIISSMRFTRAKNMFGNQQVLELYSTAIENYKATGTANDLLRSLADNEEDIAVAVAEFEIKQQTYNNFLKTSEIYFNRWSRKIKNSERPFDTFNELKQSMGF